MALSVLVLYIYETSSRVRTGCLAFSFLKGIAPQRFMYEIPSNRNFALDLWSQIS